MTTRYLHSFPSRFAVLVSALVTLCTCAAFWLFTDPAQGTPVTGGLQDVTGIPYGGPLNLVRFTPFGVAEAVGTNTIWPAPITVPVTNGVFSANLVPGFYNIAPVVFSTFGPALRQKALFVPPDTNVWSVSQCQNIAQFLGTLGITNSVMAMDASLFTNGNASTLFKSGIIPPQFLPPGMTNYTHWLLFTNLTAYCAGQWYSFSNSTTAGFNEIQAISPISTNGPSEVDISLETGYYPFTTPIVLSNNTKTIGAGMASTVVRYVGPTNLWPIQSVISLLPRAAGQQTLCTSIGLIQLTPAVTWPIDGSLPQGMNYVFADLSIQTATNWPCALIAGVADCVTMDRVGFFGADMLAVNTGGASLNGSQFDQAFDINDNLIFYYETISTIAAAIDAEEMWDIRDCQEWLLGAGWLNLGNSYLNCDSSGEYYINSAEAAGNGYPTTSWLHLAPAIYSGQNANYGAFVRNIYPYRNGYDVWSDGSPMKITGAAWQSSANNVIVSGGSAVVDVDNFPNNPSVTDKSVTLLNGNFTLSAITPTVLTNGCIIENTFSCGNVSMLVNGVTRFNVGTNGIIGNAAGLTNIGSAAQFRMTNSPVNGAALRYTNGNFYWGL
jgi:hypothetical protein